MSPKPMSLKPVIYLPNFFIPNKHCSFKLCSARRSSSHDGRPAILGSGLIVRTLMDGGRKMVGQCSGGRKGNRHYSTYHSVGRGRKVVELGDLFDTRD